MKEKNVSKSLPTILYLLMFGIVFLVMNLRITEMSPLIDYHLYSDYINYLFFPIMIYVFFSAKRTPREYIFCFALLALFYVIHLNVNHVILIKTALFIVCIKEIDYKKVFKVAIAVILLVFLACLICCGLGLIENVNWNPDGGIAYGLGYKYSTYSGYMIMFCTFMYLAIRENIRWFEAVIIMGIQIAVYLLTGTETTLLIVLIVMFCYWIIRWKFSDMPKWLTILGTAIPGLAWAFSYLVQWAYDESKPLWAKLNDIFVLRLRLGHNAIMNYKFTLFGQKIKWIGIRTFYTKPGVEYNYVDNFFLKYGLTYGLVFIALIVASFSFAIYMAAKKKNIGLFVAVIGMIIFGILDAEMADMRYQPFVLLVGWLLGIGSDEKAVDCKQLPKYLWKRAISIVAVAGVVAIALCGYNYMAQSRLASANKAKYPDGNKVLSVSAEGLRLDIMESYLTVKEVCDAIDNKETITVDGVEYKDGQVDEIVVANYQAAYDSLKATITKEEKNYIKKYVKALEKGEEVSLGDTIKYSKKVKIGVSKREAVKTGIKWGAGAFVIMLCMWILIYIFTYNKRIKVND